MMKKLKATGAWCYCLPIRMFAFLWEAGYRPQNLLRYMAKEQNRLWSLMKDKVREWGEWVWEMLAYGVNEVAARFNGQHHARLQVSGRTQALQTWLLDPIHSLQTYIHRHTYRQRDRVQEGWPGWVEPDCRSLAVRRHFRPGSWILSRQTVRYTDTHTDTHWDRQTERPTERHIEAHEGWPGWVELAFTVGKYSKTSFLRYSGKCITPVNQMIFN